MSLSLETLPAVMRSVATRPLFVMRLSVRMQIIGGEHAFRRVGVVPSGVFEGERLSGEVLEGGTDWQTVRADGSTLLDVRLVLRTTDGAMIGMTYRGIRRGPPDVIQKLERGEIVDAASYYFRSTPSFETAAPAYQWLNGIVAVGIGHRTAEGPTYSVFEVL